MYQHTNRKIAVLLKISNKVSDQVGKDIAMHAAAMAPKFLNKESVDAD
jgi:elongation factor Ts